MNFLRSQKDYVLFCGGLGSGKTYAGAMWALQMALKYKRCRGFITANTHSQLKKATLTMFFGLLEKFGIRYKYLQQEGVIKLIGGSVIYCVSMENYDTLRGVEVGWAWSDECAFYKEEAFGVLIGRIRDKRGPCQWKGTTTPNGFNWLYKMFVTNTTKDMDVVYSSTMENAENLTHSYVKNLQNMYDAKLAKQELEGKFVNLTSGKVYYSFDRYIHLDPNIVPQGHIYIGVDFNINPTCAVVCSVKGDRIYVYDEIRLEDGNTFMLAKEIAARFPGRYINIIADSTGDRRRTSAMTTDHEILRRSGFNVLKFSNPPVKDRFNNVNRLFYTNQILISDKCKYLIEDLEQLIHENEDPLLSHLSDALGYVCWHFHPFHRPRRQASVIPV